MSGLTKMATATYSTKRSPAKVSGKTSISVEHLTGVKAVPLMPLVATGVSGGNIPNAPNKSVTGRVKDYWITAMESHAHTDGGSPVTQIPDIIERDVLVVDGIDYKVREVQNWPATISIGAHIYVTVEESR